MLVLENLEVLVKGIGLNISLIQSTTVLKPIMGLSEAEVCINICMCR